MEHYQIRVAGKVQGVHFRASAEQEARSLGLTGFVKNEEDGTVYLEAEGDPEALYRLIHWCQTGPPLARVDWVNVKPGEEMGYEKFIQIR